MKWQSALLSKWPNPRFVAADLLAQAEHAEDSACLLITPSHTLAEQVAAEVERLTEPLETRDKIRASLERFGALLLVENLEEGAAFVNSYAPEHLEIITADDHRILSTIQNAGSIFLGNWSPEPAGDYASGSNHTLPTGGYARMFSPLSVESYGRKVQVQELTRDGLARLRSVVETLAAAEGLPAHRQSISVRFEEGAEASVQTQPAQTIHFQLPAKASYPPSEDPLAAPPSRQAIVGRVTAETQVQITLDLDGDGHTDLQAPVPFLNHLLNAFARHGRFDLKIEARSDTEIDDHHTVEDIGIVLGQALQSALKDKRGIARFGSALVPMDESLARATLDISGRPFLVYEAPGIAPWVGRFDTALVEEFWRAFVTHATITLHLDLLRGRNAHHALEALFKSAGLALHAATRIVAPNGPIPSTKEAL